MLSSTSVSPRARLRVLTSLTIAILSLGACNADAQRQPSAASTDAEDYRLTLATLRKALPVLYTPGAETVCAKPDDGGRDPRSMSVAEMEQRMAECPPVQRAAVAHDISLGELALAYKALVLAGSRMADEESAKLTGGTAAPLPPGALRDNVALLRENEAELARLTKRSD